MDGSRPRKSYAKLARSVQDWRSRLRKERSTVARRRRLGGAIEALESRQLLTFAIDLFADVNQLGVSSNPDEVTVVGDTAFFVADDGDTGAELWKTDGTVGGTVVVKDILPGPDGSSPEYLTKVGDEVFFTALDENFEQELWKSDGTESGTVQVFDADASNVYYLYNLTESGGKLFFTAQDSATGNELWVSDGTSGGTTLVKDINSNQLVEDGPRYLTDVGGTLFFTSYETGYYNRELWKSDGTADGTVMVAEIGVIPGAMPGEPDDESESSDPRFLTNVGGELYFAARDFELGTELFKSDGTAGGTVMVQDLNMNGSSYPEGLTEFGGDVFFSASTPSGEVHLYKSNGTTISLVAHTTGGLGPAEPFYLEVVGSERFFSANGFKAAPTIAWSQPILTAKNSRENSGVSGVVAQVCGGIT